MHRKPLSLEEGVAKGTDLRLLTPSPQAPWGARHLAGFRRYGSAGGQAISSDRRLGDACRLEGGAPDHRLLRHPPGGRGVGERVNQSA